MGIYAWNRKNGTNQRWIFQAIGGGRYLIKSHHSGKCLDNTGRAQVNRHYHQWSCSRNNRNQWFYIRNVARRGRKVKARRNKRRARRGARRGGIPSGWVMIKGRGNLCIRFAGGRKHIRQGRCNRSRNVQWRFIRYAGRYIIQNRSGYVIDLYAYKRHNGAHIYAWNRKNGTNQRWILQSIGRGRYLIKSHHSGKCLDNTGRARINRHYHQWNCSSRNANQHFYFLRMGRRERRKGGRKARGGKKPRGAKGRKGKPARKGGKPGRKGGKGKPGRKGGKGKGGKGKMKYRKNKTVKFMKGKYSFNLKTGRQFCQTKCANNKSSKEGVCFKNGVKKCKACSFTGNKTTPKGKESQQLCSIVCRSINNQKCDFYAYIDDKKKVINKRLLNRFGRIFVTKFLQKNR